MPLNTLAFESSFWKIKIYIYNIISMGKYFTFCKINSEEKVHLKVQDWLYFFLK